MAASRRHSQGRDASAPYQGTCGSLKAGPSRIGHGSGIFSKHAESFDGTCSRSDSMVVLDVSDYYVILTLTILSSKMGAALER